MNEFLMTCLIVCPLVFLATFVDAVAGGGGLISIPAYMLAGVPTHMALGTNKVVNGIGTGFAAWKYFRGGKIKMLIAVPAALAALVGSAGGTKLALLIPADVLQKLLLAILPAVAVFLALKKDFGREDRPKKELSMTKTILGSILVGLIIGGYDGLFGPGTGTFMIMAFTLLMGLDLLTASGCAKVGNLASNVASAVVYIFSGNVYWLLCVPAAICSTLGGILGAKFAMRGGASRVRWMIFVVLGMLIVKTVWGFIS
ncbi:MAG: TSUP family transporter [Oscillospiraceae bacterium]|nr:TSUP family transporter [Oscillospiraceae bacterium]